MPKYVVGDKKYNIPQEEVEGFLAAFPDAKEFTEDALQDQAGKTQPQVTGAPVEETTAPDTESKSDIGFWESFAAQGARGWWSIAKNAGEATRAVAMTIADIANPDMTTQEKKSLYNSLGYMPLGAGAGTTINQLQDVEDSISEKVRDTGYESITDAIADLNFGAALEMTAGGAIESAPSLVLAASGVGGLIGMGVTSAGDKFSTEFEENPDESIAKLALNAAAAGATEAYFERITGKMIKGLGLIPPETVKGAAKTLAQGLGKSFVKTVGKAAATEYGAEAATQAALIIEDKLILGKEKGLAQALKEINDAGIIGGFTGGALGTVSAIGGKNTVARQKAEMLLASPETKEKVNKLQNIITNGYNSILEDTTEEGKEIVLEEVKKAEEELAKVKKENSIGLSFLENENLKNYAENVKQINKANKVIQAEGSTTAAKEVAKLKIENLSKENNLLLENAKKKKFEDITQKAGEKAAEQGYNFKSFKTTEEFNKYKQDRFGKNSKVIQERQDGIFLQNTDGNIEILIDEETALQEGAINVAAHELLHGVLFNTISKNENAAINLGNALGQVLTSIDPQQVSDSKLRKRLELYNDQSDAIKAEELLTLTSDAIATGDLQFEENIFTRIGDVVRRILQDTGIKKTIKFNTGRDVYNFIKDYNRSIEKGEFAKAIKTGITEGFTGKLVDTQATKQVEAEIKKSISSQEKQGMMDTYNRLMEGVERTEYSKNNPLPRRLENELVPKFYNYVNTLVNKKFQQVQEEAIEKEDAVMILMAEVANALRTFNPAKNDDISGYVASIIARRQSMIFADVSQEFTDDVTTSKEVQEVTVEIDAIQQERIQENKKETLLEAIDVTRTVEGKTYEEHVIDVVSKNARLAIKVYNEEVSANRTVTPFVARVKDGLAKDLRQITKKFINEYGYEAFLKDHKSAILKNFTTTYLAKHPLFRKGIEKSIGGKMGKDNQGNSQFEPNWTLPTQTNPNKYEWVDTSGKKAKIDRDNAGARGLTSGPEIIRRSPKINSIISDNEFIDYHFQDGALRKKKKQNPEDALAMQIASEIGFDLLKQDLIIDGKISEQLREVGELFDLVIAEAEMNKLSKDIDRGTIKFSKSSDNPSVKLLAENVNSASAASEILTQSINQIASKDSQLAEELLSLTKKKTVLPIVDKILVPALENAIQNAKTDFEKIAIIKEFLTVYKEPVRQTTKTANMPVLRTLEQFGLRVEKALKGNDKKLIKTIDLTKKGVTEKDFDNDKTPIKIKLKPYGKLGYQSELYINNEQLNFGIEQRLDQQSEYENLVDGKISKTKIKAQNQQALERLKNIVFEIGEKNPALAISLIELAKQPQRGFFRGAAMLNSVVLNPKPNTDPEKPKDKYEKLEYEHNPPIDHVYKEIIKYLENPNEKAKQNLERLLDTMEANLVPESFHDIVNKDYETTTPTDGTGRYDRALKETNYKFDTNTFRFSISSNDKIRLNDMVSETSGLTKAEISEATATRIAKNKGKFRFYIPPSADDFAGLMYYLLRKGDLGNEDMAFIKEKLLDPFAKNHAAWESYKHRKLNEFRQFKKLIRKSPTAKLTAKNNMGFTNEDAVRVWIWNKKGTDLGNTITNAEKANLIEIVESNPDLLQFAESMVNLFAGAQNYPDPTGSWFNGSITIDVIENINEFGRKTFFQTFNDNVEELFGKLDNKGEISGPIANKLRAAYGNNYVEALSDVIYRMKNGRAREFGKNRLMNQLNNWISNSVGAVMFFNTRSALLQQVSMINFINLSDNNPIKFAQAIANPKQYWSDYLYLLNSDFLVSRRDGIKIDVNQDEIAKAAESGKNPVQSVISLILKKGFALTTWGDSHAIATGGATFYRNRINTYLKEGLSQAEAEEKAFFEFKELAEEAQQSSRPDRISQQQASTLGRIILAWANTPMQYARLTKKATLDLINGRGDWKTNMSRIVYYGAVQNLMFTYMQQGLFSMIFDGEDEEEEDAKKWEFTFNSMADGFLRGLGFGGAIASTAKNMVLEAIEQSKGRGNYDEVVWEALKLSPPLGSKIAKARAVGRTFGWKQEREKVFSEGWSLDNPAFEAIGKGVSATTNIPLDRVIRKLDNISYPMRHEVEFWQGAALYLGWGQWELGLKDVQKKEKDRKSRFKKYKLKKK